MPFSKETIGSEKIVHVQREGIGANFLHLQCKRFDPVQCYLGISVPLDSLSRNMNERTRLHNAVDNTYGGGSTSYSSAFLSNFLAYSTF